MTTYVALLRGINVGGSKPVKMPALQAIFAALGHRDVVTYIQSGNVVFTSELDDMTAIAAAIEHAIAAELGIAVPVILLTAGRLAELVGNNPYIDQRRDPRKLAVTFLDREPPPPTLAGIDPAAVAPDEFQLRGKEIFTYYPNGLGQSKLGALLARRLTGAVSTTRNWNTVMRLLQMAQASATVAQDTAG